MEFGHRTYLPAQVRSARALLGWTQKELAQRANLATSTVADFERGARVPTANNLEAMVKALEEGGIVFAGNSVARRTIASAPAQPAAGRTPFRWIEVADLEDWANRRGSQELLPELICRLIRADRGIEAQLRLPSGDAISMKGWDGQCRVETGSNYVPSGTSGWELTVQKDDLKGKTDKVYEARTKAPRNLVPAQSTFVFVAARRWEGKDDWVKARKAEERWKDVLAFDVVDLVHWIEIYPGVAVWLAEKIGKRPVNLRELESFWNEWSQATERPIAPPLILAGRDEEATRYVKWTQEAPSSLSLQAESIGEAISFVYAAIDQLPQDERDVVLSRCMVVRDTDQARKLGESLSSLYLLVEDANAGLVRWLVGQGHHVCSVFGSEIGIPTDVMRLPRLFRPDAEAALKVMGYDDEQARNIARDIGGSLAVYRRLYPSVPERALPEWALPETATKILPAFFAGAWDEAQPADKEESRLADREILQRLAGKPYDEFQRDLTPWFSRPDSPLRKSGSVWKIASPRDALFRLAACISSADLQRFSEVVAEVFRSPDPRFSVAPDERWLADVRGQMPRHSAYLRSGLGETLLILALFAEKAAISEGKQVAEKIVRDLLHGADPVRWWSLSQQMRLLSEAAPDQFLGAVNDSLQRDNTPIMELFKEDGGLIGGAHHTDLLWALESLAWDPKYVPRVAVLLAIMARLDPPGGRYGNRPINSLHNIFVWWMPQTCADFAERMDVLDLMRNAEGEIAWKLLLSLLPGNYETLHPSQKPRWREIPQELPEQNNTQAMLRGASAIADRLLQDVGERADRWVSLIESFPQLSQDHYARARMALAARAPLFEKAARVSVSTALRQFLYKHRCFADADWALPEEALAPLDAIYAALTPEDIVERIAWLFVGETAPVPTRLEGGWEAYEREAKSLRRQTVEEVWAHAGTQGVEQLAQAAPQPWLIGMAVAESGLTDRDKDTLLVRGLRSPDPKWEMVARGLLGKTLEQEKAAGRGEEWGYRFLDRATAEAWPRKAVLTIASFLDASPRLWARLEQFGPDTAHEYWKTLHPYRLSQAPEEVVVAVDKFMKHGRAAALMSVVARTPQAVSSDQIIAILKEAAHALEGSRDSNDVVMFEHFLETLLTKLDERDDVDEKAIAQLEWLYLPLLRYSRRPPKTLHKTLSESPQFFVEVLKAVYRSSSDATAEEAEADHNERHERFVRQAYELLSSWHVLPGLHDGVIDGAELEAWATEARRLAAEAGRIDPCDVYIGKLLAWAPMGADGIWPAEPVRRVIEIARSDVIEGNVSSGLLEKQGVTTRDPNAGGEREKEIAAQYRAWSEALRFKSPHTSAALENIARTYESFAKMHDQHVERSNWL